MNCKTKLCNNEVRSHTKIMLCDTCYKKHIQDYKRKWRRVDYIIHPEYYGGGRPEAKRAKKRRYYYRYKKLNNLKRSARQFLARGNLKMYLEREIQVMEMMKNGQ